MPITDFRPKPGRFGSQPTFLNTPLTAIPTTAVTTLTTALGAVPTKCVVSKFNVSAIVYPSGGGATVNVRLVRNRAGVDLNLTADTTIFALTAEAGTPISLSSTLTDVQRTILPTDTLKVVTSGSGTPTTGSTGLVANVELLVSE